MTKKGKKYKYISKIGRYLISTSNESIHLIIHLFYPVQILQAKIHRLEHLIHLKDVRIDDLQGRVESMRPTGQFRRWKGIGTRVNKGSRNSH